MSFHDELVRAIIGRRQAQGRLPADFAANLPRRQALPQRFQGGVGSTGPAQLPQPFQGGGQPGQVPFQLRPDGLFGVSPQRQPLGDFSSRFRPLLNPPARPAALSAALSTARPAAGGGGDAFAKAHRQQFTGEASDPLGIAHLIRAGR